MSSHNQTIQDLQTTLDKLEQESQEHHRLAIKTHMAMILLVGGGIVTMICNVIAMDTINGVGLLGGVAIIAGAVCGGVSKSASFRAIATVQEYLLVHVRYQQLLDDE